MDDSRVSKIIDKILPLVKEWQERPLQSVYAMVILDADAPDAPALTGNSNDNMNPSTGGVAATGSIAVLLAVVGLWAALPGRMGR